MGKRRIELIQMFQIITITALILLAVISISFNIISSSKEFKKQAETMRQDFLAQKKALIKREVMRAVTLVNEQRSYAEEEAHRIVKQRTNEAVIIAENIYQQNKKNHSDNEIKKMILDALREIRFAQGTGYYFITRLDGQEVLFADKPELEGKNLLDLLDPEGNHVIKEMISIARTAGAGFYEYSWTKPNSTGNNHKKVAYVKKFEPFNWFVGTGLYIEDIESRMKKELLSLLSKVSFGNSGYIFVDSLSGDALVTKGTVLPGNQKVWELYKKSPEKIKIAFKQARTKALNPEGGYVYYTIGKKVNSDQEFSKVAFIFGIPDWQWFIGAGVYLDEVEHEIAALQSRLKQQQRDQIYLSLSVTIGLVFIVLFLFYLVSRRLKNDLKSFVQSFDQAANEGKEIDNSRIYFPSLRHVAENVNTVLQEKKVALEQLLESEDRFRTLTELLPEAVFETDTQLNVTYSNQRAFELFGYTREDLDRGLESLQMFAPEERERLMQNVAAQFRGEKDYSTEYLALKKDGTIFPALFHVSPIIKNGKTEGLRGIAIDLTKIRQSEEEILKLRKLESVGVLAGGIAHDFNNLLAGLFGNIELAKRFLSASHKSYKYLDSAGVSMERATGLTQQLLTFAKGGSPIKETLSIDGIIAETAKFSLRGSNVKLTLDIASDLWLIDADKGQLSQVISNLVINGKQAMPGGGFITISAKNITTDKGRQVQISVQDQGIGIAPQHLDKIFDPYFSTKQQGSGLGLASCYSIITKHGGTIRVTSELNHGTLFTITLPASTKDSEFSETAPEQTEKSRDSGARILILEDEEMVQQMAAAMLVEMGHRVDVAGHGDEAIEMWQQAKRDATPYDIVICDLTIPGGMGGQEVAREILKDDPQAKLIVSSGYANDPIMANHTDHGFTGRIAKPYHFEELREEVERVLAV